MSAEGGQLPAELVELLDGSDLAGRTDLVFELMSVAASGWPHVALLSVGEVLAVGPSRLMIGLWPTSSTTANLRRSGQAVLQLYHGGAAYRAQLDCRPLDESAARAARQASFDCRVVQVSRDAVGYARLTSGPRIELAEPARVIERWEATIAALRELSRVAD